MERLCRLGRSLLSGSIILTSTYPYTSHNVDSLKDLKEVAGADRKLYSNFSNFWRNGIRNRLLYVHINESCLTAIQRLRAKIGRSPIVIPSKVMLRKSGLILQRSIVGIIRNRYESRQKKCDDSKDDLQCNKEG